MIATTADTCPRCGADRQFGVPSAVFQPLLDELGYENPATLAAALEPGESVLVQCRAFVGGLVGTDRRVLVVKRGQAHAVDYGAIEEIKLEQVGRLFKSPVCQLVTPARPYRRMKPKEANAADNAFEAHSGSMPLYEQARALLLEIRDTRTCQGCGGFVPISGLSGLVDGRNDALIEPLGWGEAETLRKGLANGECLHCQIHGARYAKALAVTDRRVLVIQGDDVHAFQFAQLEGVQIVNHRYLRLRVVGRPEPAEPGSMALARADDMVPLMEPDEPKFEAVAALIRERITRASRG